jgi:hypothetical protein
MEPMGFEGVGSRRQSNVLQHQVLGTEEVVEVTTADIQQWRDDEVLRVEAAKRFGHQVVASDLHQLAVERHGRGYGPQSW